MTDNAKSREGRPVHVGDYRQDEWESLKAASQLGDFVMGCCGAPAVLKTSINGVRFFSHLSDECATAPETIWHQGGKETLLGALRGMGIHGQDEVPGKAPDGRKWTADVLFTTGDRTVAIELQRSAQTLREFLARQQRYKASSIECYWLLRKETYRTLAKASGREVLKRLGGWPADGRIGMGMLPELPAHFLNIEGVPQVLIESPITASVSEWLTAIVNNTYGYSNGSWLLHAKVPT